MSNLGVQSILLTDAVPPNIAHRRHQVDSPVFLQGDRCHYKALCRDGGGRHIQGGRVYFHRDLVELI